MRKWTACKQFLRHIVCLLSGNHEMFMKVDKQTNTIYMRCPWCGHKSTGWTLRKSTLESPR